MIIQIYKIKTHINQIKEYTSENKAIHTNGKLPVSTQWKQVYKHGEETARVTQNM